MNVEQDEAGKLAAFRSKFGKGWDAKSAEEVRVERVNGWITCLRGSLANFQV